MSPPESSFKTRFGFKPDFPVVRLAVFLGALLTIWYSRHPISNFIPRRYLFQDKETGADLIIFTELSIMILILIVFVAFLTKFFIIPLALYFRGLSEWEWDPTPVVFWLIMTRGFSLFLGEISRTNDGSGTEPDLAPYVDILIDIVDSIFVIFMTVFLLRAYSNYFVPVISNWLMVGKTDTQYGPLLEIIGSLLIIIFGVTNFLSTYHVDFGVLLAGVGVVGLVIALAAQDTLSNFFSGILLLLDQGFKTGDMIYFNDTYCLIRDIGLRSTKIYDIVNHVMIITPNNSLANQNILNLTRPDRYYRIRIEVGVSYDSNPDQVEKLLLEVAEQNSDVEQDDPTRMPLVRFQDFGDSSLTFVLVAWINNVIKIRQINSDLHHQVFDKLKDAGVTIAFPQRDVHIHGVSEPAISKSPRPATTKSPRAAAKKSPKRAAKKTK